MAALVDDDEIEPRADPHARPVALEVAVLEAVAVGDRALVLHAGVGHLDQLVAIPLERVLAEIMLEGLKHPRAWANCVLALSTFSGRQ